MPPERKRPDIKKELSTPSEELSLLEQLEELWSDVVREDSDVFVPAGENAIFGLLLSLAQERAKLGRHRAVAKVEQDIRKVVRARHHLRDGLKGIRRGLSLRLQRCEQLLLAGVDQWAQCVQATLSGPIGSYRAIFNDQYIRLLQQTPKSVSRDKRPVLKLAQQLVRLDQLLMCLEREESSRRTNRQGGLDLAAFVGSGNSYGIAIGFAAAEMRYHHELARDAKAQLGRGLGGKNAGKLAEMPKLAMQLFSEILKERYERKSLWTVACESAMAITAAKAEVSRRRGVKRSVEEIISDKRKPPSTKTVGRWIQKEIKRLVADIDGKMRTGRASKQAACREVATERNQVGYSLETVWLEKLLEEHRKGTTPGKHWDPLGELYANSMGEKEMSKKTKESFQEIERAFQLRPERMIDAAFYAYAKDE